MVGVPRSTGCSVCIKRRIKCDEGRPECANCLKYGTTCPGYDRGLKFVVGKPHRTPRPRARSSPGAKAPVGPVGAKRAITTSPLSNVVNSPQFQVQDEICQTLQGSEAWKPCKQTTGQQDVFRFRDFDAFSTTATTIEQVRSMELQRQAPLPDLVLSIPPCVDSRGQYQLQLITSLCDSLPRTSKQNEVLIMSTWLCFLPGRFGKSKALDAAIVSFTTQQIGTTFGDSQMLRAGRSNYIRALALLQNSLNNPADARKSETHCAAILLCIYELFAGTTAYNSWMKHAVGLARLMHFRGPEFYMTDFDHAMLRACRGLIVMECMFNGKPCFLAEEKWQIPQRLYLDKAVDPSFHQLFEDFNFYLALLPELLGIGWEVREAKDKGTAVPLDESTIRDLITRTLDAYANWQIWYESLQQFVPFPTERLSPTGDPVFPLVYVFQTHSAAGLYITYWASIIILQEILLACNYIPEGSTASSELAHHICKSADFNSEGTWGGFRMGFGLRIAWEVVDSAVRRWITEWHETSSRTYAATSPQSLPEDRGDGRVREASEPTIIKKAEYSPRTHGTPPTLLASS